MGAAFDWGTTRSEYTFVASMTIAYTNSPWSIGVSDSSPSTCVRVCACVRARERVCVRVRVIV